MTHLVMAGLGPGRWTTQPKRGDGKTPGGRLMWPEAMPGFVQRQLLALRYRALPIKYRAC